MHGERAGSEGFFDEWLDLRTKAGLAMGEEAESFDSGAADDIRWIIVKRHQQASGAQSLGARLCNASDDESEVGAGSPVLARFSGADLAE